MPTTVTPSKGRYLVTVVSPRGVNVFTVTRDKKCTCGYKRCPHVRAVRKYLQDGGRRAPEQDDPPALVETCPICGAKTTRQMNWPHHWWTCTEDSGHYFQWRGETAGIREFLTNPDHPSKVARAFYAEGREEWLAHLRQPDVWGDSK